ncbi:MAG TPA: DUF2269 family protein [Gemmatimonadales bacterium]|nr:DUF2269 family protein [Gemmatimonadales bacterium]
MIRLWLVLHLLGFVLWLGGAMAGMVLGVRGRREDRAQLGAVVRAQAAIQKMLVAPGALVTVLSGLILTFRVDYAGANPWLMLMQGTGLLAAFLTLFVNLPTAARLGRLDPAADAPLVDQLRRRHALVGSIAGTLALVALVAGAMLA